MKSRNRTRGFYLEKLNCNPVAYNSVIAVNVASSSTTMPVTPELIDNRRSARGTNGPPQVAALRQLARWMDAAFEIPGLNLRFGLDPVLGLVPGLGDLVSSFIALYILQAARELGVSRVTMARMGFNILVDSLLGSVPVLGDVFDVYWKANQWNVELLERHLESSPAEVRRQRAGDWAFFAIVVAVLIVFLIGSITLAWFTISRLGSMVGSMGR